MLEGLSDPLLSLFFPQPCHICRRPVDSATLGVACKECWDKTTLFDGSESLCPKCGLHLASQVASHDGSCSNCHEMYFDRAVAAGVYSGAIAAAILHLKRVPVVCSRAEALLKAAFDRSGFAPDILVPVPLSPRRMLERGFNQAELLSGIISRHSHVRIDALSLRRTTHTATHRVAMDQKAREASVKNAFEVARPALIADRHVLLIDDILTSGATASNCAAVLKKAGALSVNVLTLARAARRLEPAPNKKVRPKRSDSLQKE